MTSIRVAKCVPCNSSRCSRTSPQRRVSATKNKKTPPGDKPLKTDNQWKTNEGNADRFFSFCSSFLQGLKWAMVVMWSFRPEKIRRPGEACTVFLLLCRIQKFVTTFAPKLFHPPNLKIQNPKSPKSKIQHPKSPKSKIQNPQNPQNPKF